MEKTQGELKTPSRFAFDYASDHVYTLLLKKDCYPRFIRSEHYKALLAAGVQPSHKKRCAYIKDIAGQKCFGIIPIVVVFSLSIKID